MLQRIRWMALGGLLTLLLVAGGSLAALRVGPGKGLGDFFFGPRLVRAEILLSDGDYRVDRGRLRANPRGGNLELKELDGSIQVVPVSPTAQVFVNGQPAALAQLSRGMMVIAIRLNSAPAHQVIANGGRSFGR